MSEPAWVKVHADVLERVERYAAELQEAHYDELGSVGMALVDEIQGLRWIERDPARCDARALKGTGTGICDRLLDEHGQCDRAASHL